jgi:hypothetical protein
MDGPNEAGRRQAHARRHGEETISRSGVYATKTEGLAMIHHGDLFDVLPTLDAESIDACVTDPPYGIGIRSRR